MALWMVKCDGVHVYKIIESDTEPVVDRCPICGSKNIKVVKLSD